MNLSEQQIEGLAPNPAAFSAGKKLSGKDNWQQVASSSRAIWGAIKGSGKSPYLAQIDITHIAYKCTCPSRQFPCKHTIALLLLHTGSASLFVTQEEPEWVKDWMDKRSSKEEKKVAEPKELTEEELQQKETNKEKSQAARMSSVLAGVDELELWLKDLVRMGMLDLPSRPPAEFKKVAARMVDAKASGLAGWVKALGNLNFQNDSWKSEALSIVARLFLLLRALRNFDLLSAEWQHTLRGLAGWSQSTKELLDNTEAETIKDEWLAVGQETLTTDEEITIQRNWLVGMKSLRTALILNFGTRFSAMENNVIPGTILEAELAFFPSILPERAAIKRQRQVTKTWTIPPSATESWEAIQEQRLQRIQTNPWSNDHIFFLKAARLVNADGSWMVGDSQRTIYPIAPEWDPQKPVRWLGITGNEALDMALIIRNNTVLPLGVIKDNQYLLL